MIRPPPDSRATFRRDASRHPQIKPWKFETAETAHEARAPDGISSLRKISAIPAQASLHSPLSRESFEDNDVRVARYPVSRYPRSSLVRKFPGKFRSFRGIALDKGNIKTLPTSGALEKWATTSFPPLYEPSFTATSEDYRFTGAIRYYQVLILDPTIRDTISWMGE